MTLSTGTKLGRYEIRSKIGEGGMGEVYLAEDTRLHRKVALKILPSELAADKDRMRRFEQEAQAAAALNHPNIAHIYEIGESDGTNFIAMEFIDGVTLGEKIHRERTELRKLLRYLQHVAEGLAKAHSASIVHRDLKPDNIMITRDGHAKILDFGLAKLIEQPPMLGADSSEVATAVMPQHSIPGAIMGTVGYMSPEQAQGKTNEIDQRSDIFSFGCILFEAATGKKPFEGESIIKSLHMVIYEPAPQIPDLNPSAPPELQRIVRRCLAKDPDERYQSIKEVAIELRELRRDLEGSAGIDTTARPPQKFGVPPSGGTASSLQTLPPEGGTPSTHPSSSAEFVLTGIKRHKLAAVVALVLLVSGVTALSFYLRGRTANAAVRSIAVMPFVNESGNTDIEYLSDGMTETLINSLSQIPNLSVKARSSVFRYKGKEIDPKKIAAELNVQAILTGRVIQRGDQLTLNLELIDAQTENVLWGNRYERKSSELVALQSEIARDVSNKLKAKISNADAAKVEKNYTANSEAYQLYLKGRFYWNKRNGEAFKKAVEYFNQAIERDPNFALAYTGLADTYVLLPIYAVASPRDSCPKAKAAAQKALEIDDTLAEAHTALAFTLSIYDWNFPEASREFQRAIELNPNYATAHQWYGAHYLGGAKRFDEAIAEGKKSQQLDPLSLIINSDLGATYIFARQYDTAIEQLRKTLEMGQSFYYAHWRLGEALELKGSFQEAIAEYEKARSLNDDPQVLALLAHVYAASGQREQALRSLDQMRETSRQRYVSAYSFALAYVGLGDKDQAFQWLEQAYQNRDWPMASFNVDPMLDNLRSDPRFADLLRRVGLPQ
jgi:serine/threonine protein kinase/Tfp pilus assembly protein PilF